jgi:hypothetical protein
VKRHIDAGVVAGMSSSLNKQPSRELTGYGICTDRQTAIQVADRIVQQVRALKVPPLLGFAKK